MPPNCTGQVVIGSRSACSKTSWPLTHPASTPGGISAWSPSTPGGPGGRRQALRDRSRRGRARTAGRVRRRVVVGDGRQPPLLRCLHGLALCAWRQRRWDDAEAMFTARVWLDSSGPIGAVACLSPVRAQAHDGQSHEVHAAYRPSAVPNRRPRSTGPMEGRVMNDGSCRQ